jgi:hypothetical protein
MKQVSGQSRWHTVLMVFKSELLSGAHHAESAVFQSFQQAAIDGDQSDEYEYHAAERIPAGLLSQYHDSQKNGTHRDQEGDQQNVGGPGHGEDPEIDESGCSRHP